MTASETHSAQNSVNQSVSIQRAIETTIEPTKTTLNAVDVFFESLVEHWPLACAAALLTGMGNDGARGLLALRGKSWHTIAQDEATSVVYGMPQAAMKLKAATDILPIDKIGERLAELAVNTAGRRR